MFNIFFHSQFLFKRIGYPALIIVFLTTISFVISKYSFSLLIVLMGLIVAGLIFLNLSWGIFLLLISLVTGQLFRLPLPFGEGGILLSDILTGIVVLAWVLKKLVLKEKFFSPFLCVPILGFGATALVSLIINSSLLTFDEVIASGFYLMRWIEYAGVYFVVSDLVHYPSSDNNSNRRRKMLQVTIGIMGVAWLLAVLGFIQLQLFPDFSPMVKYGWDPHQGRLLSTWFDPNFLGGFLVAAIILILGIIMSYWYSQHVKQKDLLGITSLIIGLSISFTALILTYSRSSYLALLAGSLIVIILPLLTKKNEGKIAKIAVSSIVIFTILIIINTIFPRAQQRIEGARSLDVTAKARIESWKQAWGVIEDNYFLGVGYNTLRYTQSITVSKLHSASGSDSSLLTIWLTTGILGLSFYLFIFGSIAKKALAGFNKENTPPFMRGINLGVLGIIFALLIHSMFVNSLLYPHTMLTIWLLVALL